MKKYIFHICVKDFTPTMAEAYVRKIKETSESSNIPFFPEGSVLYLPESRIDCSYVEVIEMPLY